MKYQDRLIIFAMLAGCFSSLSFLVPASAAAADLSVKPVTGQNKLLLGEKMFREGVLPSGDQVKGYVNDGIAAPGTSFACISCHLRSGLGSADEGVFTPPINGRTLYQQRDLPGAGNNRRNTGMNMASKKKGVPAIQPPTARPAYSDETLAKALREGIDPAGRTLNIAMPRYHFKDSDMEIMVDYLKNLSNDFSPGVDNYYINFATIITEEVPQAQVDVMMKELDSFVASANKQQVDHEAQLVKLRETRRETTYRRVKLARWLLKGAPETWRAQLEEYYRKEPVFALIGGISSGSWQPMHEFSEANRIPTVLPLTDYPVVSNSDWYTLYLSKGYFQEGEAAARYLAAEEQGGQGKKVVQIVRESPQGRALAEGFMSGMKEKGLPSPVTLRLNGEEPLAKQRLQQLLENERPDVLVFWTEIAPLKLLASADGKIGTPAELIVSTSYLGKDAWVLPEQLREKTFLTYPYRLPGDERRFDRFFTVAGKQLGEEARRVRSRTMATLRVLTEALKRMQGNFYRDYMFDVINMVPALDFPLYERLSFGPEQRYVVKGCYLVQLSGDKSELFKKSSWVID